MIIIITTIIIAIITISNRPVFDIIFYGGMANFEDTQNRIVAGKHWISFVVVLGFIIKITVRGSCGT